jgi:hypothetical protein
MEDKWLQRKLLKENYIMKILKQLSWITPLALLAAGCALPVKPDTTIADWQSHGKLPELSATGTQNQQVYANSDNYPAIYQPRIIVQTDTRRNRGGDLALGNEIRQRVQYDLGLAPSLQRVTFLVQNGDVVLQGTVKTDFDARVIVDALRDVPGVTQIRNELEINPNWS